MCIRRVQTKRKIRIVVSERNISTRLVKNYLAVIVFKVKMHSFIKKARKLR